MNQTTTEEVFNTIIKGYNPSKIILFGSHARGTANEFSDLDLLIIKETDEPRYKRARVIRQLFIQQPCAMDILVYTSEEYATLMQFKSLIPYIATSEGKIIYEKGNNFLDNKS